MYSALIVALTAINLQPYFKGLMVTNKAHSVQKAKNDLNPLKCSGVRQLHL